MVSFMNRLHLHRFHVDTDVDALAGQQLLVQNVKFAACPDEDGEVKGTESRSACGMP